MSALARYALLVNLGASLPLWLDAIARGDYDCAARILAWRTEARALLARSEP